MALDVAVTAVPSLPFLAATFLVPESPRWLASKGRNKQAFDVLERLGGRHLRRAGAQGILLRRALQRRITPCMWS